MGSVDKFVTGPSFWNLAKNRANSIIYPVQNATIYVNGEEVDPIVSLLTFCIPQFLTCGYQPYFSITPPTDVTTPFEIYATSTDTSSTNDACEPLPQDTPDLTSKVVVIRRGTCTFATKFGNAAKFGAKLFLLYKWALTLNTLRVSLMMKNSCS